MSRFGWYNTLYLFTQELREHVLLSSFIPRDKWDKLRSDTGKKREKFCEIAWSNITHYVQIVISSANCHVGVNAHLCEEKSTRLHRKLRKKRNRMRKKGIRNTWRDIKNIITFLAMLGIIKSFIFAISWRTSQNHNIHFLPETLKTYYNLLLLLW